MTERNKGALPSEQWMHMVFSRDFSSFRPTLEDAEDPQAAAHKVAEYKEFLDFFDYYTYAMVGAVAGAKRWDDKHKFVEPMSTSKMNDGEAPRISRNHEALVGLLYFNGRTKWMAMQAWYKANPNRGRDRVPRWSKKTPGQNLEYKTPYSDPFAGQNHLGGWNHDGRVLFGKFVREVAKTRKQHADRCFEVETESITRLRAKHNYTSEQATKKRKAEDISEEPLVDADQLQWYVSDEEE